MTEAGSKLQSDLDDLIGELAEDYAQRLRNGEKPDIEEYTRQHPDAADAIRQILPALEIMGEVPDSGDRDKSGDEHDDKRGMIGEYRIIREVGRGGMGVVYEAEQLSLSRRVALKVLPFAAVLDERQIQRFCNEALAAAQLDHPHIVDVYGVGCERSVHFYAMRYVEGDTLAEFIAELKRLQQATGDSPPIVPGSEAADQKPITVSDNTPALAGLSTHRSATGREYFQSVAHIGVEVASALDHAHQQGVIHRDIKPANVIIDATGKSWVTDFGLARMESGATLTMTGDLLGTLRYMSPEQALAKRVVVDHRTDVYSLGVTLYELLTLQPAYGDEDRHELLRKIAFEEPKSPRKLNRAVPEELETIILKAIAKNPNDRYETAQELADDLDCFFDGRPVSARRPTLTQQVTNWSRRHWPIVSSAAAVLILLTTVLAVSTALIWSEQRRTEAALKQAEANFELAEGSARTAQAAAGEAERQRRIAEQRADEVEIQNRRAVIHLSLALLVIETEPSLNHVRTLLDSGSADPEALIEIARILVEQFPEERGAWKLLAEAYDAADRHREALDQFEWYTVNRPDLPDAYNRLAWLLADCRDVSLRDPERAVIVAQRAVTLDPTNSWFLNTLGVARYRAGSWEKAAEAFEDSIAFGWDDGFNSFYLAMCHCRLGRPDAARRFYAAALEKQRPALPIAGRELRRIREEADALMQLANGRGPAAQ